MRWAVLLRERGYDMRFVLPVGDDPAVRDIEAAGVASVVGAPASVLSGGLLCLLGLVGVVRLFPELARHVHDREPAAEHALAS